MFGAPDGFTEEQSNWIILWESILIVFLVLLIILLFALFIRYRRTEKQAIESKIRERSLVRENEVLDHLNRTKTEFFQNMSHDFKTPLTVISTSVLNAVDVLNYGDFGEEEEEIRESLSLAQSEVMRLSRLVDGALKHAALYSNQHLAERVNLYRLLKRIEKTYIAFLERRGNKLIISLQPALPHIYGNVDMLINVFSNVITNANRYTQNGEIVISAKAEESIKTTKGKKQFVIITVSDNGSGVNPEILENIFDRGASESGSGLGLSICRTAIETYGGTIAVKSEKGVGTTVTFTVPIYVAKEDEPETELEEYEQQ
jgi:signal transduction histidine kinase